MNTQDELTALTALEAALEIASWALHHAERARSEDVSSQALESAKQDLKALARICSISAQPIECGGEAMTANAPSAAFGGVLGEGLIAKLILDIYAYIRILRLSNERLRN